jgi:type I restriction enzyme, S subunit
MSGNELPAGWTTAKVGELCLSVEMVRPELEREKEFVYIDISSIDRRKRLITEPRHLRGIDAPQRARQLVAAGDILFSTVRPNLRTIAVVPPDLDGQVASTGFCVLRPSPELADKFLYYAILSDSLQRRVISSARGINYPAVRDDDIYNETIALPPRAEQERIVEAVDRLLPAVMQGRSLLDTAEELVRAYRSSVLAATVVGRGVAATGDGDAAELLEQILEERRARWEEVGRGRYPEPAAPDPSLYDVELPERWTWATVDQLAVSIRYGTSAKTSAEVEGDKVPILRMGNIRDGEIDLTDLKYLPANHGDIPGALLEPGDVLFNRTNSAELVGKAAMYRGEPNPCALASYLIRVRLTPHFRPELLVYFLSSWYGRRWVRSVVSQQVGQANVNGTKLRSLTVPLPPTDAQDAICSAAERHLRLYREMCSVLVGGRGQAGRLEQALLDRAQEGGLVAQQPGDEPAEKLLERIRAAHPPEPERQPRQPRAVVSTG